MKILGLHVTGEILPSRNKSALALRVYYENGVEYNILPVRVFSQNSVNSTALRKAKIVHNFGLSECNRV